MPRTIRRTPGRPRSEAAHLAILRAAIAEVRAVGYDAATIEAIAARAAVGKATLYRRWRTKEALVCEALAHIMRSLPTPDTGSIRGDLHALLREQRALYADPATAGLLSGLVAAMHRSVAIARVVRGTFYASRRAAMVETLRRGVRRGELRRALDIELALDVLNAPLFYRFLFTGEPLDERLVRGVINVFLDHFAAR